MHFNSIAVLDLETTSLCNPRITELAVVACGREHCDNLGELPRVLHKFTVCVNPGLKIHPVTTDITGLDNMMLANAGTFDEQIVESLRLFLERLPQPIVLVAHNGFRFDFPILRKQILLSNARMLNIHCVDTLPFFRNTLSGNTVIEKTHPELEDPEGDELCLQAFDMYSSPKDTSQESNESTPHRRKKILLMAPKKQSVGKTFEGNETARRALFSRPDQDTINETIFDDDDKTVHIDFRGKPKSYKLQDIFEYLYGYRPHSAHRAENDAIALLQCILKVPDTFCNFADGNSILLETIQ